MMSSTVKNRILLLALAAFLATVFLIPSVIGHKPQIQTEMLVTAVGLDTTEEGVDLSCLLVMPTGSDETTVHTLCVKQSGKTLAECEEALAERFGKIPEFELCGAVVLGKSTDEGGVLPYLEYMLSSAMISPGALLLRSAGESAEAVIQAAVDNNPSAADAISQVAGFNAKTVASVTNTLLRFLSDSRSPSEACVSTDVFPNQKKQSDLQGKGEGSGQGEKDSAFASLSRASLYRRGERVAQFDETQTVAYNLVRSRPERGVLTLASYEEDGEQLGPIIATIRSCKSKTETEFSRGKPHVAYRVELSLELRDRRKITRKWENARNGDEAYTGDGIRKAFEAEIASQIESAFFAARQANADVFLIRDGFFRFHTKEYERYQKSGDVFTDADVAVYVTVKFL